jgi:predicted RNA-binding protein with PIN domain
MPLKSITSSHLANDNSDMESPIRKKKMKQRKKKPNDKDPSTAKVVLQKLNDVHPGFALGDAAANSECKNSDELSSSS